MSTTYILGYNICPHNAYVCVCMCVCVCETCLYRFIEKTSPHRVSMSIEGTTLHGETNVFMGYNHVCEGTCVHGDNA